MRLKKFFSIAVMCMPLMSFADDLKVIYVADLNVVCFQNSVKKSDQKI